MFPRFSSLVLVALPRFIPGFSLLPVPRARDRRDAPGRSNPGPAAGRALGRAGGVAGPPGGQHGHHEQAAARTHTLPRHTLQVSSLS